MELWDILDCNRQKTGKLIARGQPMRQDEYHLVVHVWISNSQGQYLISKRTSNKTYPLMWETTGGSAIAGDSSLQAALREVKEELGIELNPNGGKCIYSYKRQHANFPDFVDVWLFQQEIDITSVVFQADEVCDARWATLEEIKQLIVDGKFVNVFHYIDQLL